MNRVLLLTAVFASASALGQARPASPTECDDNIAECKEDCAITFGGSTNIAKRDRLARCLNKCTKSEQDCRETFFETRRNNLDEGAIAGSPSSRDVDSDGLPTKTSQKKPEPKVEKRDDDLREDRPRAAQPEEKKKAEPKPAEVRADEVPKSSRSQIKVDPKAEEPKVEPKPEPRKDEPAPPREEPKKTEPVREEPRAEEPPPPAPKKPEKREEPKKKDEKKRALDEWDPEAF